MCIVETKERTVSLDGAVANAVVSFADHTVSLVALVSDEVRYGRPVAGLGFNSIGRYAQRGILCERMFPRLHSADPSSLLSEDGGFFDAAAVATAAMRNEKPGGHGDRAGALAARMPDAKPSVLLDIEAGRISEVDVINGAIPREAAKAGVSAPVNMTLNRLVRALERRGTHA